MQARLAAWAGTTALALASSPAIGQTSINGCATQSQQKTTQVYFANGIRTTSKEALGTAELLRFNFKAGFERQYAGQTFDFKTAYNDSVGTYTDVVETLNQKMQAEGIANKGVSAAQMLSLIRSKLSAPEVRQAVGLIVGVSTDLPPLITEQVLQNLAETMTTAEAQAIAGIRVTQRLHTNYYSSDLQAGKRVIVIAHSQGNLFTNASLAATATSLPSAASSLGMLGVATPAASQFRGNYITAKDDRVIVALRRISTVLEPNFDNDPGVFGDFRDFFNHNFEQSYFDARLRSRARFDSELINLVANVPFPALQAGEGAIRATLVWDSQPDVDLHAFEPDGSHVYYRNKAGPSGTLDVDDTSSFGPENYFVACDKVRAGSYRIGVNYYRGSGPSTATVSLFLGDGRTPSPKTVTLAAAQGTAGDASPMILFTIGVAADANGKVQYTVQ